MLMKSKILLAAAAAGVMLGGVWVGREIRGTVTYAATVREVSAARADLTAIAHDDAKPGEQISNVFKLVGKAVEPSIVNIQAKKSVTGVRAATGQDMFKKFFGQQPESDGEADSETPAVPPGLPFFGGDGSDQTLEQVGQGSGVIVEASGDTAYVLTNHHVAGDSTEIIVTLSDGRRIKDVKVVGSDPRADLAVLKVKVSGVVPLKWGDSDSLEKGDWVIAFGSPFGYSGSMTHGIVSALNRRVGLGDQYALENFIQVDAPINPGNSGGALVNTAGELVGINTAIASRSGGFQGLGFAIPSNQARPVYQQLKDNGKVTRGYMGVGVQDVASGDSMPQVKSLGFEGKEGVLVASVQQGSPASETLKVDDIITEVDGKPAKDMNHFRQYVASLPPGTDVAMKIFRDGKTETAHVKLGEQPQQMSVSSNTLQHHQKGAAKNQTVDKLGLKLEDVTTATNQKFKLGDLKEGALVTRVSPTSIAAEVGLQAGDVITSVDGQEVKNADEGAKALSKADPAKGIRLHVADGESVRSVFMQKN